MLNAYEAAMASGVSASSAARHSRVNSRYPVPLAVTRRPVVHGLPLLVERFARVVFAAPLAQHGERVARVAPVVEQPVRRQERYGIADRTDRKTARQRLAHRTGDRFGFGFPPAHAADEHQRGAVVGQRRRVAVRRDGQSAQRMHRPSARRGVLHFVPPFAARHDTRCGGPGRETPPPSPRNRPAGRNKPFSCPSCIVFRTAAFVRRPDVLSYSPPQTSRDVPEKVSAAASMSCSAVRARILA